MSIEKEEALSEEEIASILESTKAPTAPVVEEKPVALTKHKFPEDEYCKIFVESILADFPGLVAEPHHWSTTLISIIDRIDYKPRKSVCSNQRSIKNTDSLGILQVVHKHLSEAMLAEIRAAVVEWCEDNSEALTAEGVEGAVIIETADGGMAYQATVTELEHSSSEEQPDWGSW